MADERSSVQVVQDTWPAAHSVPISHLHIRKVADGTSRHGGNQVKQLKVEAYWHVTLSKECLEIPSTTVRS